MDATAQSTKGATALIFDFFICNSSLPILVLSNDNDSCNNKPLLNIHILYINKKFPKDLVGKLDMTDTSSNKQKKIDIYWDTEDYGRKYQGFNFGYVVLTHYIAIRHAVRDRSANLSFFPPCFPPLPPFLSLVHFSFLLFFLSLLFLPFLNLFLCFSFLACFLPFILFFLSLPPSPFPSLSPSRYSSLWPGFNCPWLGYNCSSSINLQLTNSDIEKLCENLCLIKKFSDYSVDVEYLYYPCELY